MLGVTAPTPRQVTHVNQLRQLLIILRSCQKLNALEDQGNAAEINAIYVQADLLYREQRRRCGYPEITNPLDYRQARLKSGPDNRAGI